MIIHYSYVFSYGESHYFLLYPTKTQTQTNISMVPQCGMNECEKYTGLVDNMVFPRCRSTLDLRTNGRDSIQQKWKNTFNDMQLSHINVHIMLLKPKDQNPGNSTYDLRQPTLREQRTIHCNLALQVYRPYVNRTHLCNYCDWFFFICALPENHVVAGIGPNFKGVGDVKTKHESYSRYCTLYTLLTETLYPLLYLVNGFSFTLVSGRNSNCIS